MKDAPLRAHLQMKPLTKENPATVTKEQTMYVKAQVGMPHVSEVSTKPLFAALLARLNTRSSGHDARAESGASLLVDLLLELVGEGFVMQLAQLVYVVPVWKVVV